MRFVKQCAGEGKERTSDMVLGSQLKFSKSTSSQSRYSTSELPAGRKNGRSDRQNSNGLFELAQYQRKLKTTYQHTL
jgi:hypothetical protein